MPLAKTLRGAHRAIATTREAARTASKRDDGRLEIRHGGLAAHMTVTRYRLQDALLLLHTVLREAERRGYTVVAGKPDEYSRSRAGVQLEKRGHRREIVIKDLMDRVPMTDHDVAAWRESRWLWDRDRTPPVLKSVPNGRLRLSFEPSWGGEQSNWSEGKTGGLEGKLSGFFAELEKRVVAAETRAEERRIEEEGRRLREIERRERERIELIENARIDQLRGEVTGWREAALIREYIAALRTRLDGLDEASRARVAEWRSRAEAYSDRTDPTRNPADLIRGMDVEPSKAANPYRW
jgi:hypothetical protein